MKTSIELDFNGTVLEFHFGLSFLGYFYEKHDLDVPKLYEKINTSPFSFIPLLMFESYKHGRDRRKENPVVNELELTDLIDETGGLHDDKGCAAKFMEAFIKSILSRLPQTNEVENVKKK